MNLGIISKTKRQSHLLVLVFSFRNKVGPRNAEGSLVLAEILEGNVENARKIFPAEFVNGTHAIKTNIGDSLNVIVHLERRPGRRFVSEVVEIHGYDPDRDEYGYGCIFNAHKEGL